MFQKRHYEFIARTLRERKPAQGAARDRHAHHEEIVLHFAISLAQDNPRFDRERFLMACEPKR